MSVRAVTKASIGSIGAVGVSVVLALIVTQSQSTARDTDHEASQKIRLQPITSSVAVRKETRLLAQTIEVQAITEKAALLPVVNQEGIREEHRIIADAVLRRLPALCRDHLKNFYVLYANPKQRGLGGKSTIILDGTVSDTEFAGLLVHECGHVMHGNMLGNARSGESAFKDGKDTFAADSPAAAFFALSWMETDIMQAGQTDADFVTGYAAHDPFEDFAETFATYVLQRPSMVERAQTNDVIAAKLQWMDTYLPVAENVLGTAEYSWDKKVPWDATKLSYDWNPIP
ncbi:putative zinc-binding metallopeptidase [Candidatus Peribacteria bacterium]|nr:MAG: putative zinc-binding metallopeptidase [Candidatus Peribacteria bacterium]